MRVLIASDHYPPFIGGAHRQARLLATGMAARGHEVAVVTPWHRGRHLVEREDGVAVHRIKQVRTAIPALVRDESQRHQPPFPDPVTVASVRRIVSLVQPELIHAYGWLAFSVAVALGRRRRVPLLLSARDYGYFCANRTLLRRGEPCSGPALLKCAACASDYYGVPKGWAATAGVYLSKLALKRKVTGLHSVSSYVEDVTTRHLWPDGPPAGLVQVTIPSFQDLEPEQAAEAEGIAADYLDRLPSSPFILYVGAFRRVKGLEVLFDAYRRLDDPPPLVLMGTYERDTPSDFPPEATVLTDVPHAAVMAAWDRAMFGVMPSLWPEPYGATVAEAMNRGRPVIGTTPGGHSDMIGEDAGIMVPAGDALALAEAMARLADDEGLRERLGRTAAARATSLAASAVLPRFEQAYRDVIEAGASV